MRIPRFASALLLACASLSAADAAVFVYTGTLSGLNESPPNASPGTGTATVAFNDVTNMMRVTADFSGLLTNSMAAHIHIRPANAPNGGVVTQVPSFPGFPLGVTSGMFDQTYDMTLASSYNPMFLNNATNMGNVATARASLLAGLDNGFAYFNIHTQGIPSGEIRANLQAVPEPATWAMMIGGFAVMGAALRRRSAWKQDAPA